MTYLQAPAKNEPDSFLREKEKKSFYALYRGFEAPAIQIRLFSYFTWVGCIEAWGFDCRKIIMKKKLAFFKHLVIAYDLWYIFKMINNPSSPLCWTRK